MRIFFVAMTVVCLAIAGLANDGAMVGIGGSWRMMHGEHASVRMEREWVHMDIHPDYYDVTATFRFQNDGDAVTVSMGFPETGGGVDTDGSTTYFEHFTTTVDGKAVPVKRVLSHRHDESYKAFWVKSVSFTADQMHLVRVQYRTTPGSISTIGSYGASYTFTGGNWKGKVDRSDLAVDFHLPGISVVSTDGVHMVQQGNRLTHCWTDWEAEKSFNVTYLATLPGWLLLLNAPADYLTRPVYQITGPGKARRVQWYPTAMMHKGRAFISLRAFADCVDRRAGHRHTAVISWDQASKDYLLKIEDRTVRFHSGTTTMRIEGDKTVVLTAAPFIQQQPFTSGVLFVPLAPLVQAFDGSAIVDEQKHVMRFSLPIFEKK